MDGFPAQRQRMVERQVEARGIRDQRVLRAMRAVPREEFLGAGMREFAYEDSPLPIEAGQTISQPYIVALMLEAAELGPGDRVLEIGAGSGYAAAVMSRLAAEVFTIERHPELASLARARASIPALLAATMEPLPDPDQADAFGAHYDRYAGATVVLLGEASHGTSEFYRARAAITRRLIERHGFRIVAVEADWPDAAAIDRHVRGLPRAQRQDAPFQRFPTWMWRNRETSAFVAWLHDYNLERPAGDQVSFHGLDLYSLNVSIRAVVDYLDRVDPEAAAVARRRYGCLSPWASEPAGYGRMALTQGYALCERAVTEMLRELLEMRMKYAAHDGDDWFDAAQNARLVRNAEAYYRAMYYGSAESWNLRDSHMFETLRHLLDAGGHGARAVVWAHNSHVGDARETEMGEVRGEHNLGQLAREGYGADAALLGFGTHAGTVAAASDWDAPMEVMRVNPSRPDSVERLFHDAGTLEPAATRALLDLRGDGHRHGQVRDALAAARLERYIGVVYRPDTERWSHYVASSLAHQYDGWTWFDRTRAVDALSDGHARGVPETWPFGL